MSFVTTLEKARDLLLLPPDQAAADVLQAAHARRAELAAKSVDPKAPAVAKQGALRKLKELDPLLPRLEIEVALTDLESSARGAAGAQRVRHRLEAKKLAERIRPLPEGDEKTLFTDRLAEIDQALNREEHDPALERLQKNIAALRQALNQEGTGRITLAGLLAEVRGVASVIRDGAARANAEAELAGLAASVERRLAIATTPPFAAAPAAPISPPVAVPPPPAPVPPPAEVPPLTPVPAAADVPAPAPVASPEPTPPLPVTLSVTVPQPPLRSAPPEAIPVPVVSPMPPMAERRARQPDRGQVLQLVPKVDTLFTGAVPVPLRFVARPRFLLGREERERASRADFLAPSQFDKVSRANTLLIRNGEEILIQDGDGERRSTNGSKLDENPLTTVPTKLTFGRERLVTLGQVLPVSLVHIPGAAPGGPVLDAAAAMDSGRTVVISSMHGAVRFAPKPEIRVPVIAVWLFTDATIGAAPTCAVPLAQVGLADQHARLHFWQEGFWIENLRSNNSVRLGDVVVGKGATLPLLNGDLLHLGTVSYTVTITPA